MLFGTTAQTRSVNDRKNRPVALGTEIPVEINRHTQTHTLGLQMEANSGGLSAKIITI